MSHEAKIFVSAVLFASTLGCGTQGRTLNDVAEDINNIQSPTAPLPMESPGERVVVQRPVITPEDEVEAKLEARTLDIRYDPENEITLRGAVTGKRFISLEGDHTAELVRIQPGGDFVEVLIGTTKFLFREDVDVGITDQILVTGSLTELDGRRVLLARELLWSDRELILRDDDGWPLWRDRDEQVDGDVE